MLHLIGVPVPLRSGASADQVACYERTSLRPLSIGNGDGHRRIRRVNQPETGRPSIDPKLLLRMLLIGYLYGITSERKLVEELRTHLAWRW